VALTKCKECKKEVSTQAKTCPHCGVKNPGVSKKDMLIGLGAIALITVIGFTACSSEDEVAEKPAGPTAEEIATKKAADQALCRQDIACWGEQHWSAATNRCQKEIERQAKYEVKWTDEYPDLKLSQRGWLEKEEGTLTYYGDRVQFSNGYGAFENYAYSCDYDPSTKTVLGVVVEPGRL
jgi:hypothetical protein